jgi:hypothetical protein
MHIRTYNFLLAGSKWIFFWVIIYSINDLSEFADWGGAVRGKLFAPAGYQKEK